MKMTFRSDDEYSDEERELREDEDDHNDDDNDDERDDEEFDEEEEGEGVEEEEEEDEDFDRRLKEVSRALENAEPPGASFVCGTHSRFPLPGLTVGDLGQIPLPLTESAAKELIEKCRLAPYGHGERTLVDTNVRNTWELDANQLQLNNSEWHKSVHAIAESLRLPLGIGEQTKYEAKLYKMLLYEAGGMFAKHRDSEKEPGMFGTLVIVLPGVFEGGELVVHPPSHALASKSTKHEWNPAKLNPFDIKYAAFYGDCEHEVLPVKSGYRLCLTYNLVASSDTVKVPSAGSNHVYYSLLKMALLSFFASETKSTEHKGKRRRLNDEVSKPEMVEPRTCRLVSILDHKYTDGGLSFQLLKGRDRIVAESLRRFCDESNGMFALYLAKVKYSQITDGMEELEEEDDDEEKFIELLSPWIKHGATKAVDFSSSSASTYAEVVPTGFFTDISFDDEKYVDEEYMGNEGSLVEQWYKTAALIVQPLNVEVEHSMRYTSTEDKVEKLAELMRTGSPLAYTFCSALLKSSTFYSTSGEAFARCLEVVGELRSQEMFLRLLSGLTGFSPQPQLALTAQKLGWRDSVASFATVSKKLKFSDQVDLLLCATDGVTNISQIKELFDALQLKPQLSTKAKQGTQSQGYYGYHSGYRSDPPAAVDDWATHLAKLLGVAYRIGWDEVTWLVSTKSADVLVRLVAPALAAFTHSLPRDQQPPGLLPLLRSTLDEVRAKTPMDRSWAFHHITINNGTKCCRECTELQEFVHSLDVTLTLKIFKNRREHLRSVLYKCCEGRVVYKEDQPKHVVLEKQHLRSDLFEVGPFMQQVLTSAISAASSGENVASAETVAIVSD